MKAIILSAGQGKRLLPLTETRPKCLVEVGGLSILEWQLEVLCCCGVKDIVVVTGFQHEKIESLIQDKYAAENIRTLYNPDFDNSDNMFSCWKSCSEMDRDFLLLNGDTIFEPAVLQRLLSEAKGDITITISTKDTYDADDMKVIVRGSSLARVGKDLPLAEVNGESIGLSLFKSKGPEMFKKVLSEAVKRSGAEKRWYLSVIDELAQEGKVSVVDVTGLSWCEIDFQEDLEAADQVVTDIKRAVLSMGYEDQLQPCHCRRTAGMSR